MSGRAVRGDLPLQPSAPEAAAYHAAIRELERRGRFGVRLGLGRTRALLRAFGNPERQLRGALVGGTNGKGSVLALAGAGLRESGLRVGETPKPHLVTYRERLQIDGRPIDPVTFTRLANEAFAAADRVARRHGEPTEFELLTAMLFRWFAAERVDVALVEVGLGGRLDATHAWDGGVAAITNVALDHMLQLGSTIPEIAREKAAIIERGDLAVTGATGDALAVIRRRARAVRAPLREVAPAPLLGWDRDSITVELPALGPTRVGLRGRHQAQNVAVADAVLDALEGAGIAAAPEAARRSGYGSARWPGRLELLRVRGHDVLLDGAHNPAGAATLATALADLEQHLGRPDVLVHASMADKDVDGVIDALAPAVTIPAARIIATQVPGGRAMDAEALARRWAGRIPEARVNAITDVGQALEAAVDGPRRDGDGLVVVAGSLYLVGEARRRWVEDAWLADPPEAAP